VPTPEPCHMVKIKTYKLSRRGDRGLVVSLPIVWTTDLGLKVGDRLDFYRDEHDRIIIVPPARKRGAA